MPHGEFRVKNGELSYVLKHDFKNDAGSKKVPTNRDQSHLATCDLLDFCLNLPHHATSCVMRLKPLGFPTCGAVACVDNSGFFAFRRDGTPGEAMLNLCMGDIRAPPGGRPLERHVETVGLFIIFTGVFAEIVHLAALCDFA